MECACDERCAHRSVECACDERCDHYDTPQVPTYVQCTLYTVQEPLVGLLSDSSQM